MYNNTTASSLTVDQSPAKLPEVQSEVERIGYGLEAVQKLLDHLESKLVPVLAQREVAGGTGSSQPEPVRVPLAHVLHERVLVIDSICRQLESISERVEL